ncbi:TIGR04141 family sporadically distributed protein, partial [Vibrio anguillarum]|uniref:TIGR04141 family sporadically distributed protein n=1 Tax=Vibrio anguillarum TaxID=55601 RepID=UPI0022856828
MGYSFHMSPRAVRHVVLSLNDYLVYLEGAVPSVEAMKHHVVHVNNSEYKSVKSWPVYRCLYAEISYGSDQYILRNGIWYKVNQDFVTRVDDYLASLNVHPY